MDFELKGFYLKLDYLQSRIFLRKIDRIERWLTGTDGYLGYTWTEEAGVGLYLSKMASRNAESSIPTILRKNRGLWIDWWTGHLMNLTKDKIHPHPHLPHPRTIT